MGKYKIHICLIIIMITTFLVFSPVLKNQFINLDDNKFITDNPIVNGKLDNAAAKAFKKHLFSPWYKPLVYLSWHYEYKLSGGKPWIFHLNNLILHIINSILVFFILLHMLKNLLKSTDKLWIFALFGALLFALHPMKVESVAWAMERKDVLFGFFLLSGLLSYIYYILTRKSVYVLISLLAYAFGLLSKSMIIIFPLLLFVVDMAFPNAKGMKFHSTKLPFILLMICGLFAYGVLFNYDSILQGISGKTSMEQAGMAIETARISFTDRLMVSSYRVFAMAGRFFFPINLSLIYPAGNIMMGAPPPGWFLIFPLGILMLLTTGIIFLKRMPVLLISLLLFFISILPVLGMPGDASSFIADRYTYIPSLGLVLLVAWAARWFYFTGRKAAVITALVMFLLTTVNAYASFNRSHVFYDSISVWNDVIAKYPEATIAWDNRGSAKAESGDPEGAIEDYSQAIVLAPHQASLYNNRGAVYLNMNKYNEAIVDLKHALSLNTNYFAGWYNLAMAYEQINMMSEAYSALGQALVYNPEMYDLYIKRGDLAFFQLKDYDLAITNYSHALEIWPDDAVLRNNRGAAYHKNGNTAAALNDYLEAIRINPQLPVVWFNAGMIEILGGNTDEGCKRLLRSYELGYTASADSINKYCK